MARNLIILVALVGGCAGAPKPEAAMMPGVGVVIVTSAARCSLDQPELPPAALREEQERLEHAFGVRSNPPPRMRPTATSIASVVRSSSDARGMLMVYSGHGGMPDASGSNVCVLADDETAPTSVATTLLFKQVDKAAWGVFLINSCFSADVDIRRAPVPAAVITVSHGEVDALDNNQVIDGTMVGKMLIGVMNGAQDDGPDWNCDGILTDYEVFGHLNNALQRWSIQNRANRPAFNLRREAPTHVPIALDGKPPHARRCDPISVSSEVTRIRDALRSDPDRARPFAKEVANTLHAQLTLASQLELHAAARKVIPLDSLKVDGDLYIVDPPDADLERRLAGIAGLHSFPFTGADAAERLAAAHAIADFSISFEIYRFEPLASGKIRITQLRQKVTRSQPGAADSVAGSLIGVPDRDAVAVVARQLSAPVKITGGGPVEVRGRLVNGTRLFSRGQAPAHPLLIDNRGGAQQLLMPNQWIAIPCEEGMEGQCFVEPAAGLPRVAP